MNLSIAFVNDVHGYLEPHPELFYLGGKEVIATAGGYSRIASVVKDIRKNNPNILNKIGFNAMVGHWDFAPHSIY